MKMKPIALVVAGMAAAALLSTPVFAAKVSLSDSAIDAVSGKANTFNFQSDSTAVTSMGSDASANIQFNWYQWTDDHSADSSFNKGANDQSGDESKVQQNVTNSQGANALIWGSVGQNVLLNTEGTGGVGVVGSQSNMAYGVFAGGGF